MKDYVICVQEGRTGKWNCGFGPKKNDICEIEFISRGEGYQSDHTFYGLKEWPQIWNGERIVFNTLFFRPVDDSFGEWVESTVLQDAILEETLNPVPL